MGNQVGSLSEREAYVAFNLTDKVGSVKLAELVAASGSVVSAWESYPQKVSRSGAKLDWEREFSLAKRYGVEIVTPADPGYPTRLLEQPSHPLALYVKGDASVLSSPSVAIVGTRRATAYGLDQAFKIAKGLAEDGWTVLSGLALGIDAESHRGALAAEGKTCAGDRREWRRGRKRVSVWTVSRHTDFPAAQPYRCRACYWRRRDRGADKKRHAHHYFVRGRHGARRDGCSRKGR